MTTKTIDLVESEYTLITDKASFIARPTDGYVIIRAQDTLPLPDDEGMPLDPSKALTRLFDGNVYGKSVGEKATIIVLESDA